MLLAEPEALVALGSGLFVAFDTVARAVITASQNFVNAVLSLSLSNVISATVTGVRDVVTSFGAAGTAAVDGIVAAQTTLATALATRPALATTTLEVYGGGPEGATLRAAAADAGLGTRVRFHGSVPFETLPEKMEQAHIGIHLMQPVCGSFALTWANKTFDYAQAGLPVLLSDNPAHRTLLAAHRVGVLADSFSPEAIGRALEELLAHYETYAAESRKAREQWHWSTYFRGLPAFLGL